MLVEDPRILFLGTLPSEIFFLLSVSLPSTKEATLLKIAIHPSGVITFIAVSVPVDNIIRTIVLNVGRAKNSNPNDAADDGDLA